MSAPKQIIVIRKDLNMRKGKMIAQGAHASMAVFLNRQIGWNFRDERKHVSLKLTDAQAEWMNGHFTKICVYVNSEQELLDLHKKVKEAGIICALIEDAGFTEFKEPTYTALGIGPDYPEKLDPITGSLPLL